MDLTIAKQEPNDDAHQQQQTNLPDIKSAATSDEEKVKKSTAFLNPQQNSNSRQSKILSLTNDHVETLTHPGEVCSTTTEEGFALDDGEKNEQTDSTDDKKLEDEGADLSQKRVSSSFTQTANCQEEQCKLKLGELEVNVLE